jgi:hypothetical protein
MSNLFVWRRLLSVSACCCFVIGCAQEPAPFVAALAKTNPDINVSFGGDTGSSGAGTSGDAASSGVADGGATGDTAGTGTVDTGVQSTPDAGDVNSSGGDSATDDTTSQPDVAVQACGNGKCEAVEGENCSNCEADCGKCAASCGDNKCDPVTESCANCEQDCGKCCGDNKCEAAIGESCGTCPADCGICCGNKICETDKGESCLSCAQDCGSCCGNKKCDAAIGEDCKTCALDCGPCGTCGDGKCEAALSETCGSCEKDCGACAKCGDGKCEGNENPTNCAQDCKTSTCSLPCHPVTQKGCGATVQCYPNANSAICASAGSKKLDDACKGINDCLKGLLCVNQLCKKLCSTKAGGCTGSDLCEGLESSGKPLPCDLGACFGDDKCNLVTSDKCPASHNCVPSGGGKKQCAPVGTKGQGATCVADVDCQKHYMCLGEKAGVPKTCLRKCHAGGGQPPCGTGLNCATVTTGNPPKPAGDFLGVCIK